MHIPATDSLRHERVGIVKDENASMLLQAYVKTGATNKRGAYDPVEDMSRPFPYLINTGGDVRLVESMVDNADLSPISDMLVEYVAYIYESMQEGEWVEELEKFDGGSFESRIEAEIAEVLMHVTQDCPQTLFRTVYETANKMINKEDSVLSTNPLRDIQDRERYGFSYLPEIENVDNFDIMRSISKEENGEYVLESLWIRYKIGENVEERPLISYQNAGFVTQSPNVNFGDCNMKTVSSDFVNSIVNERDDVDSNLNDISIPADSRTIEFLENYAN